MDPVNVAAKFEVRIALLVGGTQNIWTVPEYAHAPFSP